MNEEVDVNEVMDGIVSHESDDAERASAIAAEESEPAITKGAQKRIDELTRQKHDERRRADRLANELDDLRNKARPAEPAKVTASGAPDPEKYPAGRYDPDYLEALTEYKVEQRFERQAKASKDQEKQGTIAQLEAKAVESYPDYTVVKSEFLSHPLTTVPVFMEMIKDSDNPAELTYFLGKNPEELEKLGEMTPAAANRYIGRLEARFNNETPTPEQNKKTVTSAPKPITPLGSAKGSAVNKDPDKMTMEEYAAYRKSLKK